MSAALPVGVGATLAAGDPAQLLALGSGPALLGVTTLLAYARTVLRGPQRAPGRAWSMLGAGALVVVWLLGFLTWSASAVWAAVTGSVPLEPQAVLLVASWLVAAGVVVTVLAHAPAALRHLSEAYRAGEGPWALRSTRSRVRRE